MSFSYSIDFTAQANQNPLSDSSNWSTSVWGSVDALQILSSSCQGQKIASSPDEYVGDAALVGPTLSNDQTSSFTVGTLTNAESIQMLLRANAASTGVNAGRVGLSLRYDGTWFLSGTDSSPSIITLATGTTTFAQGDVFKLVAQGTTISAYQNGSLLASATQSPSSAFSTPVLRVTATSPVNGALAKILAYSAGNAAYSAPDCRHTGNFPNTTRNVQGTLIYDVQSAESRAAGAPVDSRAAGAPVDARVSKPQNSRTSGTYGPGVN